MAPSHNATKYKTRVGTFQLKYASNGGKLGSYSCKLSEVKKKPYLWLVSAQELVFMVLRANRPIIEQTIITYCSIGYMQAKKQKLALKGYVV